MIWFLTGMDSEMGFQVTFFIKCSLAFLVRADIFFLARVCFHVDFKPLLATVGFVTILIGTSVLLHVYMSL